MTNWDASKYIKFGNQRTQPAIDLAARISHTEPKSIADLGCGPGNSTAVLRAACCVSDSGYYWDRQF